MLAACVVGASMIGFRLAQQYVPEYCADQTPSLISGADVTHMRGAEPQHPATPEGHFHPLFAIWEARALLIQGSVDEAEAIAETVWAHADDGWLAYTFDTSPTTSAQVAPWYSALTQGEAVGLFAVLGQLDRAAVAYETLRPGSPLIADDGW